MINERKIADVYLDFKRNGISFTKIIKKLWGIKLIIRLLVIVAAVILYSITKNLIYLIVSVLLIGATIEALSYYFKTLKLWPLTEKILDWTKIEEIVK